MVAPRSADCGVRISNHVAVCGEVTLIEDRTVGYGITGVLVHTLEGGDIAAVGAAVAYRVDLTVVEESGIVSTEDEVGGSCDVAVFNVLTAKEELNGILIAEKVGVFKNESVCLYEKCKRSVLGVVSAEVGVEYVNGVPVVGEGDILNGTANCTLSDRYGSGGVGNLYVSGCIGNAVKRVPLNGGKVAACALYGEVGDSDLKLFDILTCADLNELLSCGLAYLSEEVECLLYGIEGVIAVNDCTYGAGIILIDLSHIHAVNDGGGGINYVDGHGCRNGLAGLVLVGYGESLCACGCRIKAGYGIACFKEGKLLLSVGGDDSNRETLKGKLLAYRIDLLEAIVEVNAVARGVGGVLYGGVEAKLHLAGLVYVNGEGDGGVILVAEGHGIGSRLGHINGGGINGHVGYKESLGLAAIEYRIQADTGKIKVRVKEEIGVAGGEKLKSALLACGNDAVKLKKEYVNGTAGALYSPYACGNLKAYLYNGAALVIAGKLDRVLGSVGCNENYLLSGSAARAVLNEHGERAVTGYVDLDSGGAGAKLYGLGILNALEGLGS